MFFECVLAAGKAMPNSVHLVSAVGLLHSLPRNIAGLSSTGLWKLCVKMPVHCKAQMCRLALGCCPCLDQTGGVSQVGQIHQCHSMVAFESNPKVHFQGYIVLLLFFFILFLFLLFFPFNWYSFPLLSTEFREFGSDSANCKVLLSQWGGLLCVFRVKLIFEAIRRFKHPTTRNLREEIHAKFT